MDRHCPEQASDSLGFALLRLGSLFSRLWPASANCARLDGAESARGFRSLDASPARRSAGSSGWSHHSLPVSAVDFISLTRDELDRSPGFECACASIVERGSFALRFGVALHAPPVDLVEPHLPADHPGQLLFSAFLFLGAFPIGPDRGGRSTKSFYF